MCHDYHEAGIGKIDVCADAVLLAFTGVNRSGANKGLGPSPAVMLNDNRRGSSDDSPRCAVAAYEVFHTFKPTGQGRRKSRVGADGSKQETEKGCSQGGPPV